MAPTSDVIGRNGHHAEVVPAPRAALAAVLALAALGAGCSGDLACRSVAEFAAAIPLDPAIRTVCFEVPNGTVQMDVCEEREVRYGGGARRAADTPEELAAIEAVELVLAAAPDPADPTRLVVRAPAAPAGIKGVLAFELGIRLPAELEVEIDIAANGHIEIENRGAPLRASTGRGDLRFERCAGGITARTGRGTVIVYDHRGDLDLTAAFGDMQVFVREPGEEIRLDTGEGTVQCYLPPTAGFRVDARAAMGRCGSSFGLEVEQTSGYSAAMTGTRGDGRTGIVMRTGKGYLTLGSKQFD